ncbi:hypothetical protein JW948_19045 [bacterium]|nr:hypothetical protein [bacterium]
MKKLFQYSIQFLLILIACFLVLGTVQTLDAQGQGGDLKWLRIGELQDGISEQGTELEGAGTVNAGNNLYWPSAYGLTQTASRAKCIWIGAKGFYDPTAGQTFDHKVVGVGPRPDNDRINQVFPKGLKLVGKFDHPVVIVDDALASITQLYDQLDETDPELISDRMIEVKVNTSIGVSVTKKIYAFSQENHDDYFVYDWVIKNTGIYNAAGEIHEQDLNDLVFFLQYRYALVGEAKNTFSEGWGQWEAVWGRNTINQVVGTDPASSGFQYRALYSWYGPHSAQTVSDDWGCPYFQDDGRLSAARYAGAVVLHADKSTADRSDDLRQPRTTMYMGSDDATCQTPYSQFDESFMAGRYTVMTAGHAEKTHAEEVGDGFANEWGTDAGGYCQTQGYGPYDLAFGDSLHFIIAEGVHGLDKDKAREVGLKWVTWFNGNGTPELVKPDGSTTTDFDAYKREWVQTSEDSILKVFSNALSNYESGYQIPQPPPPPSEFKITSGGDRIRLTWTDNAASWPNFDGYVIYRSEGNVSQSETVYRKIFECDAANAVHEFDDLTAIRGFDYYYYIQSKDDGSTNDIHPGAPLLSSKFWTLTSLPAYLRRPQAPLIDEVRVVPNPYDIRARKYQFGDDFQYDRIAFYELPGICKVKVFTERGDLIWEKDHSDGSGDELWDSFTSSGQIVVSGIYILYVEVTEDIVAEEDVVARHDYYDGKKVEVVYDADAGAYTYFPDNEPVYKKDDVLYPKGSVMYKKGESVYRKFVIIR